MKKYNYSTHIELGDTYEFCIQYPGESSRVFFGEVEKIERVSAK